MARHFAAMFAFRSRLSAALRRRGERGNVAVTAALVAFPVAAAVGMSLDLADSYRQKEKLQSATDAAALAAARALSADATEEEAEAAARQYLAANTSGLSGAPVVESIEVDVTRGTVVLLTKVRDPVSFGGVLGLSNLDLKARAETKGAADTLEVALVLDNSGSMDQGTRIEDLRAASAKFIEVMAEDATVASKVSLAVVPFSSAVNVGSQHLNASWIDNGSSSIHAENLNTYGDAAAPSTRKQVYALLQAGYAWKGCVEARTGGFDITDQAPNAGNPQTLFTPMFAPDEPDGWFHNLHINNPYTNSYLEDDGLDVKVGREKRENCSHQRSVGSGYQEWRCKKTFCNLSNQCTTNNNELFVNKGNPNHGFKDTFSGQCSAPAGQSGRVWNQSNTCKYKGGGKSAGPFIGAGPNFMCDSAPIMPLAKLSTTKADLTTKVTGLQPEGGTNILEGLMWGWRVLSNAAPFEEGKPSSAADNRKVMIVMTDGQNTLYNSKDGGETLMQAMNKTQYSPFGYGSRARLAPVTKDGVNWEQNTELMAAMDSRLAQACTNAKTAGITVYTVILTSDAPGETTDWTAAKKLMRECASSPTIAYAPSSSDELEPVFIAIAKSIQRIHLAR